MVVVELHNGNGCPMQGIVSRDARFVYHLKLPEMWRRPLNKIYNRMAGQSLERLAALSDGIFSDEHQRPKSEELLMLSGRCYVLLAHM